MLDPAARDHLGVPARVTSVTQPLPWAALTSGERAQWSSLTTEARRRDWLLGRAALRAVLPDGALGTAELAFPHPRLSLTHAGGTAFAARADGDLIGTGIDFEPGGRTVRPEVARFFLRPAEMAGVDGAGSLLRLWTVKEALYKATPLNGDVVLLDYQVTDATARLGTARGPRGEAMRYASVEAADGVVTVAVALRNAGCRAAV